MSLPDAANIMGISEDEVLVLAQQGKLEAYRDGGRVLVRPALVSTIKVV